MHCPFSQIQPEWHMIRSKPRPQSTKVQSSVLVSKFNLLSITWTIHLQNPPIGSFYPPPQIPSLPFSSERNAQRIFPPKGTVMVAHRVQWSVHFFPSSGFQLIKNKGKSSSKTQPLRLYNVASSRCDVASTLMQRCLNMRVCWGQR